MFLAQEKNTPWHRSLLQNQWVLRKSLICFQRRKVRRSVMRSALLFIIGSIFFCLKLSGESYSQVIRYWHCRFPGLLKTDTATNKSVSIWQSRNKTQCLTNFSLNSMSIGKKVICVSSVIYFLFFFFQDDFDKMIFSPELQHLIFIFYGSTDGDDVM